MSGNECVLPVYLLVYFRFLFGNFLVAPVISLITVALQPEALLSLN